MSFFNKFSNVEFTGELKSTDIVCLYILATLKTLHLFYALTFTQRLSELRPRQTRTHCCGHIVADTNVSPFARARSICCGHKFCVRDTENVSDFVQTFCVRNKCFPVCSAQETSWATMCLRLPGP